MNFTPIKLNIENMDKNTEFVEIEKIRSSVEESKIPSSLREKIGNTISRIESVIKYGGNATQIDSLARYVDWLLQFPWESSSEDVLDIALAKNILDKNHYGMKVVKDYVLEHLAVLIMQKKKFGTIGQRAPILLFVGLAGTGKTTFAKSVAEALNRTHVRIPFGGLSSGLDLRGASKMNAEAEPGLVVKSLIKAGKNNPVVLLDEIDRVAPEAFGAVMGTLLELLDPQQNNKFTDHYVDFPIDLSKVIFIATSNNTQNISSAVLDRLEIIQMPTYSDEEKIVIAKKYILPRLVAEIGIGPDVVKIDDAVWQLLARASGFDPGIRSVERKVESIVRKVALGLVTNKGSQFNVTQANMREFISP